MGISRTEVEAVARLARLELSDEEVELFGEQLGRVLEYVDQLQDCPVDGVEPYISAAAEGNVFREDASAPGLPREEALANSPEQGEGGFVVPKVVEGS